MTERRAMKKTSQKLSRIVLAAILVLTVVSGIYPGSPAVRADAGTLPSGGSTVGNATYGDRGSVPADSIPVPPGVVLPRDAAGNLDLAALAQDLPTIRSEVEAAVYGVSASSALSTPDPRTFSALVLNQKTDLAGGGTGHPLPDRRAAASTSATTPKIS